MKPLVGMASALLLVASIASARADDWTSSAQMADAAAHFLESLGEEQRQAVHLAFEAPERGGWSNLPILMVPPSGLLLKDMNDEQRHAAQALLRASMSSQGYAKFTGVMRLDDVLHARAQAQYEATPEEERDPARERFMATRDARNYAVTVFGEPGSTNWGWQLVGHHAAANFTVSDGRVAFTPTFFGSSPRVIESGAYAGTIVLSHEADRGFELMHALSPEQRARAHVAEEKGDGLVTGPGHPHDITEYEGLPASELDATQKRLLRVLVEEYVRNADFDAADAQMQAIEAAGWDAVRFSWHGPVDPDAPFYYRVHGPRVLIEYDRVDANHDHTIVRDPANDYGADWLGKHLEEHHPTPEQIREAVRQLMEAASTD